MAAIARPEARVLVQLSRQSKGPGLRSRCSRLASTVAKAALDGESIVRFKERIGFIQFYVFGNSSVDT